MDDVPVVMQPSQPPCTDDAAAPAVPPPAAAAAAEPGPADRDARVPGRQCTNSDAGARSASAAAEEDLSLCGGSSNSGTATDAAQPTVRHEDDVPAAAAAAAPPPANSWAGSSSDFGAFGDAPLPSDQIQSSPEAVAAPLQEEEEDDDGFGAWDDGTASLPAAASVAPAAAPAPAELPSGGGVAAAAAVAAADATGDLLALPPLEFRAAAASLLSCLLPGHGLGQRAPSAATAGDGSLGCALLSLPTFASLEAAYPALAAWGTPPAPAPATVLGRWHGSRSEARLLHRMGLAPSVAPLPPASTASLALQQALSRTSVALPRALASPAQPPISAVLDRSAAEVPTAARIAATEAAAVPRAAPPGPPVRHISCDDPFAEMAQQETSDSSASGRAAIPITAPGVAVAAQTPYAHSVGPSGLGSSDGSGGETVDESVSVAVPVVAIADGWGHFAATHSLPEEPGSELVPGSGWDDGGDVVNAAPPTAPATAPAAAMPPPGATLSQHAACDQDAQQASSAAGSQDPTWGEGIGSLEAGSAGASVMAGTQEAEGHTATAAEEEAVARGAPGWGEEEEEEDDDGFADFAAAAEPAAPLPATHANATETAEAAAAEGVFEVADEPLPEAVAAMPADEVVAGAGLYGDGEEDGFSDFAEAAPTAVAVSDVAAGSDPLPPTEATVAATAVAVGGAVSAAAPPSAHGLETEGAEPPVSGAAAKAAALAAQLDDLSFMLSSTILPVPGPA